METVHYTAGRAGRPLAIAIGKFDGFHIGHRKIVSAVCRCAVSSGLTPAVFTFRRFPVDFYLVSWEERLRLLAFAGIRRCIWSDFPDIAGWSPEHFIAYLAGRDVRHVVVGSGFVFGSRRSGDIRFLRRRAASSGIGVTVVRSVIREGRKVSSTRIRACVRRGEMEAARRMLGRYFAVEGRVVSGSGRGRQLGFPTANLDLVWQVPLRTGVYAGWAGESGIWQRAAVFVGAPSTFGDERSRVEVFIDEPVGDLSGKVLRVLLVSRIRGVRRFRSVDLLVAQIGKDLEVIRSVLRRSRPPAPGV